MAIAMALIIAFFFAPALIADDEASTIQKLNGEVETAKKAFSYLKACLKNKACRANQQELEARYDRYHEAIGDAHAVLGEADPDTMDRIVRSHHGFRSMTKNMSKAMKRYYRQEVKNGADKRCENCRKRQDNNGPPQKSRGGLFYVERSTLFFSPKDGEMP